MFLDQYNPKCNGQNDGTGGRAFAQCDNEGRYDQHYKQTYNRSVLDKVYNLLHDIDFIDFYKVKIKFQKSPTL